jgi:hypothetical protein
MAGGLVVSESGVGRVFHVERLEVKDSGFGVWERDGSAALLGLAAGGEKGEVAGRVNACDGCGKCGLNVVNGTHGDNIEAFGRRHGFDAVGPNFGGEMESANGFAEEGDFLVLGFGEGDAEFGAEEGDGKAGEAGSGAEVEECLCGGEMSCGKEAFAEMTSNDLFGVADGGEVGAGVPLEKKVEVGRELVIEIVWNPRLVR